MSAKHVSQDSIAQHSTCHMLFWLYLSPGASGARLQQRCMPSSSLLRTLRIRNLRGATGGSERRKVNPATPTKPDRHSTTHLYKERPRGVALSCLRALHFLHTPPGKRQALRSPPGLEHKGASPHGTDDRTSWSHSLSKPRMPRFLPRSSQGTGCTAQCACGGDSYARRLPTARGQRYIHQ